MGPMTYMSIPSDTCNALKPALLTRFFQLINNSFHQYAKLNKTKSAHTNKRKTDETYCNLKIHVLTDKLQIPQVLDR